MSRLRVLSLFTGVGMIDLGLQWAGMEIAGQVEIEPYCRAVLDKHWPGLWRRDDVQAVTDDEVRALAPDVIAGGFPCQDVSVAGKGKGVEHGERSGLWREFARLIRAARPRWVIAENVPGLRTRGADLVLGDLEEAGYACWPLVVGAEHVGAPHKRHRVWIVANAASGGQQADGGARRGGGHVDKRGADVDLAGGPRLHRWPMPPGPEQHGWEAPRLTQPGVGDATDGAARRLAGFARRHALKALGNGAVPQVVCEVGRVIVELEGRALCN